MLGHYKLESLLKLYLLVILLHLYVFEKGEFRFQANEAWKWRVLAFTRIPPPPLALQYLTIPFTETTWSQGLNPVHYVIVSPHFITLTTFVIFYLQTAVVPHVSLDVHHADFGQLQDPNAVAQKVRFFSLWAALETVGGYSPFTKSER